MNAKQQALTNNILHYINHALMVAEHSKHVSAYHTQERLNGMHFATELKKLVKREGSMTEICKFTLMVQRSLTAILPLVNNVSYKSSEENLNNIIETCKQWLNPTITIAPGTTPGSSLRY